MTSSPSTKTPSSSTSQPATNPRPHQRIHHETLIYATIEDVWRALFDVNDWEWNKWTRLDAGTPATGLQGTLRACYEGNDKDWQEFPFEFAEVSRENFLLAWKGSVGPFDGCLFRGYHTMRLERISKSTTKLVHTEVFGGILPFLRMGLPYTKLDRNYRLMNEALKAHVESNSTSAQQKSQ
mmetsp:Transcript_732/g.1621  ORF Transcript_732/g.1621 Transcript_732/m.1621 type:complete len:181 (-) Transcript_732:512-1054(-)|eukprot:CAMPEP_0201129928 /NCGR_PEP_ID=MMETSP0850-20130426/38338_1 /ASSEMBLY_ACC=CAM_ASM_000622 /TAXON_ID=183588 /ORGANISM="Pseudo-nitzschia fraudulenta, Strain WWA7" /LENGTH=180 /DNA_ID=CAMNT_0047399533 /DNA_START=315 /DNA_END=857 /DNA_ORIENTATION=-